MSEEGKNKKVENILLEIEKIKIIIADDDIKREGLSAIV